MVETVKHSTMKAADMHSLVRWDVVDAAALPTAPVEADLHKLAYVQSSGLYFVLQAITPEIVWKEFSYEGNNPIVDVSVTGLDITFTYEDGATVVVSIPENPTVPNAIVDVDITGSTLTFLYAGGQELNVLLPTYNVYTGNAVENITYSEVNEEFTITFRDTTTAVIPFAASGGGGAGATVGQAALFLNGADTTNWLPMDGSAYDRTAYPALAALFPAVTLDNALVQVWDDNNTLAGAPLQATRMDAMIATLGNDEVIVSYSAGSSTTRVVDTSGVARDITSLNNTVVNYARWDATTGKLWFALSFTGANAICSMQPGDTTFTEEFTFASLLADLEQVQVFGFVQGVMFVRYKISTNGSYLWGYVNYTELGPVITEVTALTGFNGTGTTFPVVVSGDDVVVMGLNGTGVVSKVDVLTNTVTDVVTSANGYDYSMGAGDGYIVKEIFGTNATQLEIYDYNTGALLRTSAEFAGNFYSSIKHIDVIDGFAFVMGFAQNASAPYDFIGIVNLATGQVLPTPTNVLGQTVESIFVSRHSSGIFLFCSNNSPDGTTGYGQLFTIVRNEDSTFTLEAVAAPDASLGYYVYAGE